MEKKFSLILMLFTVLAAIAVIVVSCQKENGPKEPTDIYEQIGKLHNEGLDYILREIKTQPVTKGGGLKLVLHLLYMQLLILWQAGVILPMR